MRWSLSLLVVTAWVVVPAVRAHTAASQTAAAQPAAAQQTAADAQPAAAPIRRSGAAHPSRRSTSRHSRSRPATDTAAQRSAVAGKADGVLDLGATDITGNKELPKVMVIVPWKDSLGAGGVVKPTDSLLDEVLTPVDRGVFQRQVRYYQQLDGAGQKAPAGPAGQVAPVGDNH